MLNKIDLNKILKEVKYNTSRSSGKGGQNVNKVETKVELVFNINASLVLNDQMKSLLLKKLNNKVNSEGNVRVVSQTERTQLGNKKKAIEKFLKLINNALKKENIRINTVKSYSAKLQILEEKRKQSKKKQQRRIKDFEDL
ncbi:MAG: aminoacyl-tRNA hydrolase [Ignavibacteria bacterium]|nr:aminoacyl-tRNA hydrolase [Ignavibacteria bacterium]